MNSQTNSSDELEKCRICLSELANKCVINECKHEFCYECLLQWSKVSKQSYNISYFFILKIKFIDLEFYYKEIDRNT